MTSQVVNQERTPSDWQFQCRLCFLIRAPRRRRRLFHRSSHLRSWTELVDASAIIWSEWNILKFLVSSSSCAKLVEAHITGNGSHLASNRAPLKNLRAIKKGSFRCQTPTCLCKSLSVSDNFSPLHSGWVASYKIWLWHNIGAFHGLVLLLFL